MSFGDYAMASEATSTISEQSASAPSIPMLAKNRYGREEFLAMIPQSTQSLSLVELLEKFPEFYVENAQRPVCLDPINTAEQLATIHDESLVVSPYSPETSTWAPSCSAPLMPHQCGSMSNQPFRVSGVGRGFRCARPATSSPFTYLTTGVGRGRRVKPAEHVVDTTLPSSGGAMLVKNTESFEKSPEAATGLIEPAQNLISSGKDGATKTDHCPSGSSAFSEKSSSSSGWEPPKSEGPNSLQRWCYIDPDGKERGPFESIVMAEWFAAGYFPMEMEVRKEEESKFATLGDLIKKHCSCPFAIDKNVDKSQSSFATTSATSVKTAIDNSNQADSNIETSAGPGSIGVTVGHSAFRRSVNMDRSIALDSKVTLSHGLPNQQENRNLDQQRAERANSARRAKLAVLGEQMKRKREEERRTEEERQKLQAAFEEAEKRRSEAIRREREQQIREIEERFKAEQEETRRVAEAARILEEEERKRERALEEQRQRLEASQRREEEDRNRWLRVFAEEERLKESREEQSYGYSAPAKPAPWAASGAPAAVQQTSANTAGSSKVSLREIQMEEERQARAEKRQELEFARQTKYCARKQQYASGPWKVNMWNRPGGDEGLWASDSAMEDRADAHSNSGSGSDAPTDPFTKWCFKQIKALNQEADAATVMEILNDITSPSDAEQFILSYFGDCLPAKEFLTSYLHKRQLALAKVSAKPAQYHAADQAIKKVGKPTKKVFIDANTLGFRSTADPNRVNAGRSTE